MRIQANPCQNRRTGKRRGAGILRSRSESSARVERNADGELRLIGRCLSHSRNNTIMRVAMATVVALLILNFADEHYNSARYTRGAMAMLSHIARSMTKPPWTGTGPFRPLVA
jgi:hypothetical protein